MPVTTPDPDLPAEGEYTEDQATAEDEKLAADNADADADNTDADNATAADSGDDSA